MAFIEIDGVAKTFSTRKGEVVNALERVDLAIGKGEFVAVVGPSGCGKSTLLKILAGLVLPSQGALRIEGKPVEGPSTNFGVVFQNPLLLDWRTVVGNIMVPIEVLRRPREQYKKRCDELLQWTGIAGFAQSYPGELSGGMQQRVAICRALVYDPGVLLMDEPFGALDAMTRDYMNVELLRIWERSGKTILLITHSISEAVFLADRVIVMSPRPGRIAEIVPIELGRPRSLDVSASVEFGNYVRQIRRHFTAEMFDAAHAG